MSALDIFTHSGSLVISSETIADGSGVQHKNVLDLIDANLSDFEDFGRVAFETRTFATAGGTQSRRIALLNEQQATLLMTFQRNTDQVRAFKKALVKAFFEMARQVAAPAQLSRLDILTMALESEQRAIAAEATVHELAPKAEAYGKFMDSTTLIKIEVAARQAGVGRTTAYRLLREAHILQRWSKMPTQPHAHRFHEVASTHQNSSGEIVTDYTTKVRPEHFEWLVSTLERLAGKQELKALA